MKRDFDAVLKMLDGISMKAGPDEFQRDESGAIKVDPKTNQPIVSKQGADATLKTLAIQAFSANLAGDDKLTGLEKYEMYKLASQINKGGVIELSLEDLTKIKTRIGQCFGILVIGAAYELLEQDPVTQQ